MTEHRGYPTPRGPWDPPAKSTAQVSGKGKKKGKNRNKAQPVQVGDHVFDSGEEARFYIVLSRDPDVIAIELHPVYQLVPNYTVRCARCRGTGKKESPKTGKPINCELCKGKGERQKEGVVYNSDFRVTYKDDYVETIDVKPSLNSKGKKFNTNERFPMKKRMFEAMTGETLVIVRENGSMNFEREEK